jgi:putative sigma-54 modulation protein
MQLQIKARNTEVSDSIRRYAEEKFRKLERHLNDSPRIELELAVERNPSIAACHVAEATVWTRGPVLRAREQSPDMRASIDTLTDKLARQVKRYRERRGHRAARGEAPLRTSMVELPAPLDDGAGEEEEIVKTKQFPVKPMAADEAVLQLELVGHDFFVFLNAESGDVNVVYRRRDGRYGLIEPQV